MMVRRFVPAVLVAAGLVVGGASVASAAVPVKVAPGLSGAAKVTEKERSSVDGKAGVVLEKERVYQF